MRGNIFWGSIPAENLTYSWSLHCHCLYRLLTHLYPGHFLLWTPDHHRPASAGPLHLIVACVIKLSMSSLLHFPTSLVLRKWHHLQFPNLGTWELGLLPCSPFISIARQSPSPVEPPLFISLSFALLFPPLLASSLPPLVLSWVTAVAS